MKRDYAPKHYTHYQRPKTETTVANSNNNVLKEIDESTNSLLLIDEKPAVKTNGAKPVVKTTGETAETTINTKTACTAGTALTMKIII